MSGFLASCLFVLFELQFFLRRPFFEDAGPLPRLFGSVLALGRSFLHTPFHDAVLLFPFLGYAACLFLLDPLFRVGRCIMALVSTRGCSGEVASLSMDRDFALSVFVVVIGERCVW